MTSPADLCGAAHPTLEDVYCDKDLPCWVFHESLAANVTWDGTPFPDKAKTKAEAERALDEARQRATPAETTGPPVVDHPNAEMVASWEAFAGDWLGQAKKVLYDFCLGNALFTTRDVWRLLPNPPGDDRRKMVVVIQYGVKKGWLEESGQYLRMSDPYVTLDGVRFPMNKAVPIYRSRLLA